MKVIFKLEKKTGRKKKKIFQIARIIWKRSILPLAYFMTFVQVDDSFFHVLLGLLCLKSGLFFEELEINYNFQHLF